MKKLILCIAATFLLFSFVPMQLNAATPSDNVSMTAATVIEPNEADVLVARLNEIKAMDKSNLSVGEKRALRKETRSIKRDLAQATGGVYLSVGAIILIALLLILLL